MTFTLAILTCIAANTVASRAAGTIVSLRICNRYHAKVYFAVAFEAHGTWASTGWWRIAPNTCSKKPIAMPSDTVYLNYVVPSEGMGLVGTKPTFDIGRNIDHDFTFTHADKPQPGGTMFSFTTSPTYVGGGTFHITATMLANGTSIQW